jgi:hypothetical protein
MAGTSLSGTFEIGGDRFTWTAKRYAGMSNADSNYRGLAARVMLSSGVFRELVIEFHPDDYPGQIAGSSRSFEARLIEYTQKAIDSGWRPESRGKPFRIEAEKSGR